MQVQHPFPTQVGLDIKLLSEKTRALETSIRDLLLQSGSSPESPQFDAVVQQVLDRVNQESQLNSGDPNTLVINDFLPEGMQAEVLGGETEAAGSFNHALEIQKVIDQRVKPGMRVVLKGKFKMSKLVGYDAETYGQDNVSVANTEQAVRHGMQPCLVLKLNNNSYDFTNATFIVDKVFQDIIHAKDYVGINRIYGGRCYTQAVLDIDPNGESANDWAKALGTSVGKPGLWPRKDRHTGASIKGTATDGFNTTTQSHDLANYRNNAIDTRHYTTGGYPSETSEGKAFPQDDGSNAVTWGVWRGGFIGNLGSALVIFQTPKVSKSDREKAQLHVYGFYGRGFRSYTVEMGLIGRPNGDNLGRFGSDQIQYTPHNVYLYGTIAEDNYEGGIQLTRGVNIWELYSYCCRMGHPNWSLEDYRTGKEAASQVDPGYGSSSQRQSPVNGRYIIGGRYIDCARKGIDAHHGVDTFIEKCTIKAGVWGIQVALEENQTDPNEDSLFKLQMNRYTIRDCTIHSSIFGVDFINGAFSQKTFKDRSTQELLQGCRTAVHVENSVICAPYGWRNNYGRDGFHLSNCTFVFDAPYGIKQGTNTSLFRACWVGSGSIERNGIPLDCTLKGIRVYNSPAGNYAVGLAIQDSGYLLVDDFVVDTTPYKTDSIRQGTLAYTSKNAIRSGHKTLAVSYVNIKKKDWVRFQNVFEIERVNDTIQEIKGPSVTNSTESDSGVPSAGAPESPPSEPPAEVPAAPVEVPTEKKSVITFDFDGATEERIVDTTGTVPINLVSRAVPRGFKEYVNTSASPRYITAKLANDTSASAGVYPVVRGIHTTGEQETTLIMPIRVRAFGNRTSSFLFMTGNGETESNPAVTGALTLQSDKQNFKFNRVTGYMVNGQAVTTNDTYPLNEWMIITVQIAMKDRDLSLAARFSGNGQLTADIGEGLEIHPDTKLSNEALLEKVQALKVKYNIGQAEAAPSGSEPEAESNSSG